MAWPFDSRPGCENSNYPTTSIRFVHSVCDIHSSEGFFDRSMRVDTVHIAPYPSDLGGDHGEPADDSLQQGAGLPVGE